MAKEVLQIDKWETVVYPEKKVGTAEIVKTKYKPGYYLMEGVDGYLLWQNKKSIPITELRIDGEVVMLDDPLHWIGMKKLAEASYGKVMVCGLGLGLIVHHLVNNPKVKEIDIYEINEDVIKLMWPLMMWDEDKAKKVKIIHEDILTEPWRKKKYDVIINDIYVKDHKGKFEAAGTGDKWTVAGTLDWLIRTEVNNPGTKVFVWGVRDREHNPAVTIDLPKKYIELVEGMRK